MAVRVVFSLDASASTLRAKSIGTREEKVTFRMRRGLGMVALRLRVLRRWLQWLVRQRRESQVRQQRDDLKDGHHLTFLRSASFAMLLIMSQASHPAIRPMVSQKIIMISGKFTSPS